MSTLSFSGGIAGDPIMSQVSWHVLYVRIVFVNTGGGLSTFWSVGSDEWKSHMFCG